MVGIGRFGMDAACRPLAFDTDMAPGWHWSRKQDGTERVVVKQYKQTHYETPLNRIEAFGTIGTIGTGGKNRKSKKAGEGSDTGTL